MTRPLIGILGNHHLINDQYPATAVGDMLFEAVADVCDAVPMVLPANLAFASVDDILAIVDGVLLPGGRPNVHPSYYGHEATPAHGAFDRNRDAMALGLICEGVNRGLPILGVCRGFQEMAVAYSSTLHPEIRDLPGRMNHRMPPDGTIEEKFEWRHTIALTPGGKFAEIFGKNEVMVNSLHGQGIIEPGPRVVIEGHAPDGTPEAIHIKDAPGFAMGVQWHPEYRAKDDPVSRPLFAAFGEAVRAYHAVR